MSEEDTDDTNDPWQERRFGRWEWNPGTRKGLTPAPTNE